jgi:RNA polymerase sigma factor (sigma-70 family)
MEESAGLPAAAGRDGAFKTTHWTVVMDAARCESSESSEAFGRLYIAYWYPLYAYVRRRGYSPHDAEDITQNFFARLIEKQSLAGLEREGGRFRSFLLTALSHFLANQRDRAHAQKRGSGAPTLPLDYASAEACYSTTAEEALSPEVAFEQNWALALLEQVFRCVRAECEATGKAALFDDLRLHLQGDKLGPPYADVAARHKMSESAIKVTVHRLRRRYGELLRQEIARTVESSNQVDEELRHLISVVTG